MTAARCARLTHSREVPDELIDKVLNAGLWAAHACNLQSIRYLVVREKDEPWLFRGSDIPPGPVHIAVLQDERCYLANTVMSLEKPHSRCGRRDDQHPARHSRARPRRGLADL